MSESDRLLGAVRPGESRSSRWSIRDGDFGAFQDPVHDRRCLTADRCVVGRIGEECALLGGVPAVARHWHAPVQGETDTFAFPFKYLTSSSGRPGPQVRPGRDKNLKTALDMQVKH